MEPSNSPRWQQYEHGYGQAEGPPDPASVPDDPDYASAYASATAAWRDALRRFGQLKAFAAHFAAAKSDRLMASVRSAALWAVVGVVGLFVLAGVLVACGVLLVTGLADAFSRLLGTGPWAGQLIASVIVLTLIGAAVATGLGIMRRKWRKQTEQKYEQRQLQQRIDYGQDVRQCAADVTDLPTGRGNGYDH